MKFKRKNGNFTTTFNDIQVVIFQFDKSYRIRYSKGKTCWKRFGKEFSLESAKSAVEIMEKNQGELL